MGGKRGCRGTPHPPCTRRQKLKSGHARPARQTHGLGGTLPSFHTTAGARRFPWGHAAVLCGRQPPRPQWGPHPHRVGTANVRDTRIGTRSPRRSAQTLLWTPPPLGGGVP